MECPQCGLSNPPAANRCTKCDTPLELSGLTATSGVMGGPSTAVARGKSVSGLSLALQPGSVLGERYEILHLLGEGGMGAVYKARDRELDRFVALKIIRPELANRPEALQRFKQELLLARQVTHKNVIRIFDLGEADGLKFISMDFIDGQDLQRVLRQKGRFSPEEAMSIISQVCRALDAAHSEGVIHRDLKPQNIMVDKQDKVTVMDFGIARSLEQPGMTQTGALLGTPAYMSPEQAKGEPVDARSDVFTVGIIFYELLTGETPYRADTALATLLKRTQERARPPVDVNPTIPRFLSDVVVKCLEVDPQFRYLSALEILKDLEARQGPRSGTAVPAPPPRLRLPALSRKWVAVALAALALVLGIFVWREKILFRPRVPQNASGQSMSLAVLPFRNASGDSRLDWLGSSLAEMLRTEVGHSSRLRTVSSERLYQILRDLRISPDSTLDAATFRRLGEFSNAETVVWGQYAKFGERIRIDATLQNLKGDHTAALKAEAANEKELPEAVDHLAQAIRENVAFSPDIVKELQAQSYKPSSKSIQALRYYNEGLQLARQGNNLEAVKRFEASTQDDPEFALAYAKLGQTYAKLGHDREAEQFSRKAVDRSGRLPPQEKYLILASHARIMKDNQKAIESYENLARVSPEDSDVLFDLAGLYEAMGSFDLARDRYTKVLARDPKYVDALLATGRVEIKRGNPQGGLEYLNRALSLAIELENKEEKATILQAIGVAYRLLNKPEEALRNYQESLEIKRTIGDKRGMAASLSEIAQIQARLGRPEAALASLKEALQVRREIGDTKGVGDTLIGLGNFYNDRGQYDQALELFKESLQIERAVGNENYQALCLNNVGIIYLSQGDYDTARTYLQQALQLYEKFKVPGDIARTLHNLAETSMNMGEYDVALPEYLHALDLRRRSGDKRGEAMESYGMGTLFEYQGRYGAAVNSIQEALKTFQELHDRSRWMAEILGGYGNALAQAGRGDEAQKSLEQALRFARELKNQALIAQTLNFQGDRLFYRGDFKSARTLFEQALQVASRTTDRRLLLLSKMNVSKIAVKQGRAQEAITALRRLAQESDTLGLKYLSLECSIHLAEALVNTREYSHAQEELERAVERSEKLGMRMLLARGHYLLATALRLRGNRAEASRHYGQARRILDEIRQEAHSGEILKRGDLAPIYAESVRWSQGPQA